MNRLRRGAAHGAALGALTLTGCAFFPDPAERLVSCIWKAAERVETSGGEVTATCRLQSSEPFTVVLHPTDDLPDSELVAAGLDPALLPMVHQLRPDAGVDTLLVLPRVAGARPSYTVVGWRTAAVPEVLVVDKPAHATVEVVVREGAYGVAVVDLR